MQLDLNIKLDSVEELLQLLEGIRPTPVPLTAVVSNGTLEKAIDTEALDEISALNDDVGKLWEHMTQVEHQQKIQRGALEETAKDLRDIQRAEGKAEKPGQALALKGVYCRFCGKMLNGTTQRIFCSQACAGRWTGQHRGQKATPRMTLKDEKLGTTVVAGVGVRDN